MIDIIVSIHLRCHYVEDNCCCSNMVEVVRTMEQLELDQSVQLTMFKLINHIVIICSIHKQHTITCVLVSLVDYQNYHLLCQMTKDVKYKANVNPIRIYMLCTYL